MVNTITRLSKPPKATLVDPLAQVKWIFFQLEAEHSGHSAKGIRYAKNKYLSYLKETGAYYPELKVNPRFKLTLYWEADALLRFNRWLIEQNLTGKTRYNIYKRVRNVMDLAYGLRAIENIVYHAPMYKGVPETKQRAAYAKREQEVINAAMARWLGLAYRVAQGYTPTGEGISYRRHLVFSMVEVDGVSYKIQEASKKFNVPVPIITRRLKYGYTARQAVGLDKVNLKGANRSIQLIIEGVKYESTTQAAKAYKVDRRNVSYRLKNGYSPEQAVGLVPLLVSRSSELGLLWSLENDYGGDSLAMIDDFRSRRLSSVIASEKRLRGLFLTWGVWPYIDDRLIMPLFVRLAMLTGLNVEALKELEVDSFQLEHKLTGQPVIYYRKSRSGSSSRSEDRELHVSMLEFDELYPKENVVSEIQSLIELTLKLTSKLRAQAPEKIKKRLFIFEDIEKTRRTGFKQIVAVEPRNKAGKWYVRFAREEGLYKVLGEGFSFNVARCRPTLVTNMILSGVDLFQAQVALGHESIQTTASYLDELQLKPVFNKTVSEALLNISKRSQKSKVKSKANTPLIRKKGSSESGDYLETLSGFGCTNPYSPSEDVKKVTGFIEGSLCKYWNMCLLCDNAIVTENSLPKLMVYKQRVKAALKSDSPSVKSRKNLYADVVKLIDGILEPEVVFPSEIIENARRLSASLDDLLIDQLIFQGL